jgi:hypothetical protein
MEKMKSIENDKNYKRIKLFKKLFELEKKIQDCKIFFETRDRLYQEIAELGLGEYTQGDFCFVVKDNFIEKNKSYKVAGVNRFEVQIKQIKNESKKV